MGDETTPANVVWSPSSGASNSGIFSADAVLGKFVLKGIKITSTVGALHGVYAVNGSIVDVQGLDFGSLNGGWHMLATQNGQINTIGSYVISGGAAYHMAALQSGSVSGQIVSVTLTGTPGFAGAFARASRSGTLKAAQVTYTGAATGPRFLAELNGVVLTAAGGPLYFPGSVFTGNTSSGSTTVSSVSSFTGLAVGNGVSGAGIQPGTTIAALSSGTGTLTLSQVATATATGVSLSQTGQTVTGGQYA